MIIWITTFSLLVSTCFAAPEKNFTTCFPNFGCIEFTKEWFNSSARPENLPPVDRNIVNTKFLYLNANQFSNLIRYDPISSNPDSIKITTYQNTYNLIMLIHDFTSNGYTGWIKHMAIVIAALDNYNVISVDWQEGAEPPYLQAICNARVVALEIVHLLNMLEINYDLIMADVHLIGHGVGAHIAGYVGKSIGGRIGRITGLDPTGPYFEGMPAAVRLNHGDALYVEVIHTDGEGYYRQGTMQPLGNMDFYFNNGSYQPGCRNLLSPISILRIHRDQLVQGKVLSDCSHKRAFKYYIEAIRDAQASVSCSFLAVPLGTPGNKRLNCKFSDNQSIPVQCAGIGLRVDTMYFARQINSKYEVRTASCKPFCINSYQVEIDFAKCKEADEEVIGYFNLTLTDIDGTNSTFTINQFANDSQAIIHGRHVTFVAWSPGPVVENVATISVTWHFTAPFCFMCRNATCIDKLKLVHVRTFIEGVDEPKMSEFCPPYKQNYTVLYDQNAYKKLVDCDTYYKVGPASL